MAHKIRKKFQTWSESYVKLKYVAVVYIALGVLAIFAYQSAQQDSVASQERRDQQVLYIQYVDELRAYDRCLVQAERSDALRELLLFLANGDDRLIFVELLDDELPPLDILDDCGVPPEQPGPIPDLLDDEPSIAPSQILDR